MKRKKKNQGRWSHLIQQPREINIICIVLVKEQNTSMSVEENVLGKRICIKIVRIISTALSATSIKPSITFLDWKNYKLLKM